MSTISATVSTFGSIDIPVFIGIQDGRVVDRLQRSGVPDNPRDHDTGHPVPLLSVFKNSAKSVDVVLREGRNLSPYSAAALGSGGVGVRDILGP